ncbi:MAG: 23S rRNA (adenine(2030)-N(6))-methyltransferase RlmJ [Pseudomonadota bacterium]
MLSYQHAYHAGGPADLHKHAALCLLLARLTAKPRPITYIESHAGRGLYDLDSAESAKTGEAARGVDLSRVPGDLGAALADMRARHGGRSYPGSPLLAATMLRPDDKLVLCELHPQEHAALKNNLAGPGVSTHRRDGHEGLVALSPPTPRRGLALIDPSYEVKSEYAKTAVTAQRLVKRWPEGVVMIWYPLLPSDRHLDLTGPLETALPRIIVKSEVWFTDIPPRGMQGSGLVILNPPYGLEKALSALWSGYAEIFQPAR